MLEKLQRAVATATWFPESEWQMSDGKDWGLTTREIIGPYTGPYMYAAQKKLPLPRGWRWRKIGEIRRFGDLMHDPRSEPCATLAESGEPLGPGNHPVRTREPAASPEKPCAICGCTGHAKAEEARARSSSEGTK